MKNKDVKVNCPQCKCEMIYDVKNPHRPFCSSRCKDRDLIKWHDEEYKLAGADANEFEIAEEQKKEKKKD